jgi:CheY-like chemotaxis protein
VIEDNGIGISRAFLSHIFEPFERESSRLENNTYGSGLGMSIAKGIVDMMGGSISVESEVNVGTRFTVILEFRPVNPGAADERTEEDEMTAPELSYPGSGDEDMAIFRNRADSNGAETGDAGWIEGRRLLLVEDNALNREIAEEMLQEDGFKVETAENGKQALLKITGAAPWYYSAVLMDIQMPVMDGYEATEKIRMLPDKSRAQIPVIAMTANAFNEDRSRAAECGMDAYITKPVDVLTLRYVLRRVLR